VARGGESGWWQWLIPALVVMVVLYGAISVRSESHGADSASTAATNAAALHAAIRESSALQAAVRAGDGKDGVIRQQSLASIGRLSAAIRDLDGTTEGDSDAGDLVTDSTLAAQQARQSLMAGGGKGVSPGKAAAPTLAALTPRAGAVSRRFEANAQRASAQANRRLTLTLLGSGVLAVLMLCSFFSKRARSTRDRSEQRFRSLIEHSSELIAVVDRSHRLRFLTGEFERRLGYAPEDLLGRDFLAMVHPDDRPAAGPLGAVDDEEPQRWRLAHSDGSWIETEMQWKDLLDDPAVRGYVITIRDVAQRRALEEQIRHQAFHDSLTALANRALFEDRLNHALERLRRDESQGATVIFIDLDDFKTVNDSLGHAAGDDLLRAFAACLAECTRRADTVARFGGDEFAVLVEGAYASGAAAVIADRIHATLEQPIRLEQDDVYAHASIGMASGDATSTADELIRNADLAMYAAKADGKGRSAIFEPDMHSAARKRLLITGELRRALEDGQISVNYQPLVRLSDGRMLGAEALLRWTHPELGSVPPVEFIPLAEDTGLIDSLGSFVLHEACRQLAIWQVEHTRHPDYVSVNLSARQFQREGAVVEDVVHALDQAGLDGENLMLEITESILLQDREAIIRDLEALRQRGVRIAIDDFGTGYSALSYLREFPIDTVKMDRSFVHNLGSGSADSALIRSVVELGEALDMQIIAEGIEGQGQLDSVTGLRCDVGQGYFFAPPLDAEGMRAVLDGKALPTATPTPAPAAEAPATA
jgi:diguanylate cyclase (GGDEF)-like protein/PAS domain S-box-containing protein